jgi:hypothetical protein
LTSVERLSSGRKFIMNRSGPAMPETFWLSKIVQRRISRRVALVPSPQSLPVSSITQSWITPDWVRIVPSASRTGTSPIGLMARNSGLRASPLKKSTKRGVQGCRPAPATAPPCRRCRIHRSNRACWSSFASLRNWSFLMATAEWGFRTPTPPRRIFGKMKAHQL